MENTAAGYVDFARFSALKARAADDGQAVLADVADEFEALFIDLMLKAAREAGMKSDLFDSGAMDTYREMFDQQIAKSMAASADLGIGAALERQFGELVGTASAATPPALLPIAPPLPSPPAPTGASDSVMFVNRLAGPATRAARRLGVSADAIIAQAALETGFGRHVLRTADGMSSHNYFGIKAGAGWDGAVVNVPTTEYVGGRRVTVRADFRAYPSAEAAFEDYAAFVGDNPRYRAAVAAGADESGYLRGLADAGYATDPAYAEKILDILERVVRPTRGLAVTELF
ncbi:MAG: glucosaminidase domain-containing protein [Gammaproteobacteria bacterium]